MEAKEDRLEEQMRQAAVEKLWLNYFNNTLLEQGMITPAEHRQMQLQIRTRKPSQER